MSPAPASATIRSRAVVMTVKSLFIASVDHIQGVPWQTGLHLLAGNVEPDLVYRPTDFSHRIGRHQHVLPGPPVFHVDNEVANVPRDIVNKKVLDMADLPVAGVDMIAGDRCDAAQVRISVIQTERDVSVLMHGGFGEIILPAVQEGSSIFPGKINPVIPETMIQGCFQVLGCERATRLALEHGELNLNVFEGVAAVNIFDAIEMMDRSIALFAERCVSGIVANKKRCRELASRARY